MTAPENRLVAENVTLEREGRIILDGVSLPVKAGRILALIGPNGAGKSSLLSILSGLWKADSGRTLLNGADIQEMSARTRAQRIAVMRQETIRPPGLTVLEVVELGRLAHGSGGAEAQDVAWRMLRRLDLEKVAARDTTKLSGGEWQRVVFARTLAQIAGGGAPGVLLLDEPAASLDPAHQHVLLAQAGQLAQEGHAVVIVLHDLNLTSQYADEVALLRRGRLHRHGLTEQIMQPEMLSEIYDCPIELLEDRPRGLRALLSHARGA